MNIQIHNTDALVELAGLQCRVWEGVTDNGVAVFCLIPRISHKDNISAEDMKVFRSELDEVIEPSKDAVKCFSLRQVI